MALSDEAISSTICHRRPLRRIHRSSIVRVAAIGKAQRDLMGRLSVRLLHDGPAMPVSRSHAHLFNRN